MLRGLWEDDAVHFRIWLDVDDGAAVKGVESLHAEDVSVAFDEFDDAEGKGVRATGGAARKDSVNLLGRRRECLQNVALRQMCPVENDQILVLLDAQEPVGEFRMNLDRRDLLAHASLPRNIREIFVGIPDNADFLKLHNVFLFIQVISPFPPQASLQAAA